MAVYGSKMLQSKMNNRVTQCLMNEEKSNLTRISLCVQFLFFLTKHWLGRRNMLKSEIRHGLQSAPLPLTSTARWIGPIESKRKSFFESFFKSYSEIVQDLKCDLGHRAMVLHIRNLRPQPTAFSDSKRPVGQLLQQVTRRHTWSQLNLHITDT